MHFSSFLLNPRHFKQRMSAHYKQLKDLQNPVRIPQQTFSLGGSSVSIGGSTGGGFSTIGANGATQKLGFASNNGSGSGFDEQQSQYQVTSDIMFSEQLEFSIVDPAVISIQPMQSTDIRSVVWSKVIPLVKTTLLFNPDSVLSHNKAVVEDVVKSSQDLDMQVMNFITNSLLPNCTDSSLESAYGKDAIQSILVQIIDNGCNSVYSSQKLSQGSSSLVASTGPFGNTLSKFCLNNLFELCRFQPMYITSPDLFREGSSDQQDSPSTSEKKIHDVKKRIASITTPVLINRCRDTLRKYASDEQKSGNMTLPRQRVSEAVFILEKLRQLDCFPEMQHHSASPLQISPFTMQTNMNQFTMPQLKSKKGHLVQLMPIFADLVLSNEASLKEHLRLIFLDISEAIAESTLNSQVEHHKVGGSSGGEF